MIQLTDTIQWDTAAEADNAQAKQWIFAQVSALDTLAAQPMTMALDEAEPSEATAPVLQWLGDEADRFGRPAIRHYESATATVDIITEYINPDRGSWARKGVRVEVKAKGGAE